MIRLQEVENKTLLVTFCPLPQSALTVLYVDMTISYVAMLSPSVSFSFPWCRRHVNPPWQTCLAASRPVRIQFNSQDVEEVKGEGRILLELFLPSVED